MAKPNTIFNRLDRIFKPDGKKTVSRATNINSYSIDNKEIIRTTDKGEYDRAKLQAQQAKFLSSQWRKVDNETYQQAIHYETTRIGSYTDFENMEFYPEISAALDIMMEEASTLNEDGKILSVYSESDRIKRILQDLFFNRLDLHTNLPMWIRNVCKYGDNFIYLKMEDDMGIVGATQLRNFEIERRENDLFNGHYVGDNSDTDDGDKDSHQTRFFWKGKDVMFKSWQVGHFRLLGDDRKLPYGTCLKGDTRINTEFGVKEIKDIEIGTKVWSFNTKTQEKELSPILDKIMSGTKEVFKISTRHNYIDASKEHKILVATNDGEFIYKNVCDLQIGDLLVLNKNEHTNKKIKIDKSKPNDNKTGWFNNINNIPDYVTEEFAQLFGFLIGDGWLTTHNSKVEFALGVDVETNQYYMDLLEKFSGKEIIINSKQATLNSKLLKTILERMGFGGKSYEKRIPDWVFEMDTIYQKAFVSGLMDADGWATRDQWVIGLHIELNNKPLVEDLKILLQRIGYKSGSIRSRIRKTPIIEGRKIKNVEESHLITFFDSYLTQMKKYEFKNRKTDNFILEPIQTIESIGDYETYDIYVENNNHNFYANNVIVHNSVLEKARRIWKQLLLSEDAMLIYRVTRAPERRVYKVFVGNIDDEDVEPYMNDIANRFKRTPLIDSQTGQIDLRYNQMAYDQDFFIPVREEGAQNPIDTLPGACIALDTRIPLLDGRTLELQEIISEWDEGNRDLWVYSCDPNTGELAPGMITWAGETRKDAKVLKVTLDNGESIITTPDHKWVHRTDGFVEAQDLVVGDSLMPFYRDEKKLKSNTNEYGRVWDSYKQEWVFTHRMVTDSLGDTGLIKEFHHDDKYINQVKQIRHHKDHNRFNNNPSNLVWMNGADHMRYHQSVIMDTIWSNPEENIRKITKGVNKYISNLTGDERRIRGEQSKLNSINSRDKANETFNSDPNRGEIIKNRGESISKTKSSIEFKEKFSEIAKNNWGSDEYRHKVFSKKQTITFSDELYSMFLEMFKLYGKADLTLIELNANNDFMCEFIASNKEIRSSMTNLNKFTRNHLDKMLKERGFKNYRDWCKITAEELGYKNVRAWRYYIDKSQLVDSEYNYNHKIINIEWLNETQNTGTITVDGDELYHNYHTFALESGVYIKNSNLDQIADIEYLQRKLFTALRVPKSFLGFEEAQGEGKNLAMQDIRFTRTINRIQQSIIMELNKIAIIHLYLLGLEDELDNFKLTMQNPSTQAEMLKIEHLQQKLTAYRDAVSDAGNGFGAMSMTKAKNKILGMSNDEIKQDLLEQRMEMAASAELAKTESVIKHTGFFDKVDKIYGDMEIAMEGGSDGEEGGDSDSGSGGGGGSFGGGGPISDEDLDFGDEESELDDENFEDVGDISDEDADFGDLDTEPVDTDGGESNEQFNKSFNILTENYKKIAKKIVNKKRRYRDNYMDKLVESYNKDDEKPSIVRIEDKTLKVNESINNMINNIDDLLES